MLGEGAMLVQRKCTVLLKGLMIRSIVYQNDRTHILNILISVKRDRDKQFSFLHLYRGVMLSPHGR